MESNYETWYANIRKVGTSYVLTIPKKVMEFAGYKENDTLKVLSAKNENQN